MLRNCWITMKDGSEINSYMIEERCVHTKFCLLYDEGIRHKLKKFLFVTCFKANYTTRNGRRWLKRVIYKKNILLSHKKNSQACGTLHNASNNIYFAWSYIASQPRTSLSIDERATRRERCRAGGWDGGSLAYCLCICMWCRECVECWNRK